MSTKELPRATLSQLLERAVPYERWRAPLDRRLQMLTLLALAALAADALFVIVLAPALLSWSHSGFFLVAGGILHGLTSWVVAYAPLLLLLNLGALALFCMLLRRTRGLQTGTLTWQRAALAEVAAGAAGALPMAVSLAIILLNLILWVLAICLFLWLIGLLLGGSGR